MLPKHSAKELYFVPKHRREEKKCALWRKVHVLDKLYLGKNFGAVDCESKVNESTIYIYIIRCL